MNDVSKYFQNKNVSNEIQNKMKKYIEYSHDEENNAIHRGRILLNNVSLNLKEELRFELFWKMMKKIPIFEKFSENFLRELSYEISEYVFTADQTIVLIKTIY